ncbi:MAG: elongation factor P maturation arginine rhamnosyltransferase EarP [Ramlibacter sp.]|nr:elongation factor P maturation arginine rhamnosyltransferase EarP [Ramlibacter sp.]
MLWDIFCKVIDNHGDIGVCWRLSTQLADRGESVRLWVDDASALSWMAPRAHNGVQVFDWDASAGAQPGQAVIEAFGCELPGQFQEAIAACTRARGIQPAWINLEYLTAQSFAERSHGLPSPVFAGPAAGLTKHFFFPGFTPRTGGLLREPDLVQRQEMFDRAAWLQEHGIEIGDGARLVSLFCYEPATLDGVLDQWAAGPGKTRVLVTAGRAAAAVRATVDRKTTADPSWNGAALLLLSWLPLLSQREFDHLLWACDLNFVRGEDSLVRAIWAGKPLVWHIYAQDDNAHHDKLSAFLDRLRAPGQWRDFHRAWNGIAGPLPAADPRAWGRYLLEARRELLAQDDLLTQLMRFAHAADQPPAGGAKKNR